MQLFNKTPSSKLVLSVFQGVNFIHPTTDPGEELKRDLVIQGTISLHLVKPKQIDSIVVRLKNVANLHAPGGFSINETLYQKEQAVSIQAKTFQPGVHTFEFAFPIPVGHDTPDSAPYERTKYGDIRANITAEVKGQVNLVKYGMVCFVAASGQCISPPPLDFDHAGFHDDLGIYRLEIFGQKGIVSGLSRLHLVLESPPDDVFIHRIQLSCSQSYKFTSPDNEKEATAGPEQHIFSVLSAETPTPRCAIEPPLARLMTESSNPSRPFIKARAGERLSLTNYDRLPDDDHLRPSTFPGTVTPLHLSHTLDFSITYSTATSSKARVVKFSKAIQLASCTLMPANILMPEYSEKDTSRYEEMPQTDDLELAKTWFLARDHLCAISTELLMKEAQDWPRPRSEQERHALSSAQPDTVPKV